MKKVVKVLKKIFDVLCWITVIILVASVVISFIAHLRGTVPTVFGYSVYRVSSGSMSPELEVGDVILGKSVENPAELKVGDVVTYQGSGEMTGELITHEVIVAPQEENGELMLQTKGIANEVPDSPISADKVVSVMVCEVPFLSALYNFFFSPWGLLAIIGLIILVFIDELIVMIKTLTGNDTKAKPKDINEIIGRMQNEDAQQETEDDSE